MTTATIDLDTGEVSDQTINDLRLFPLPTLDGHRADTLRLSFTGTIDIDLMDNDQVSWFRALRFGQELDLAVTGTVAKHAWVTKTNADGDETVVHTLGLNIHTHQLESNL